MKKQGFTVIELLVVCGIALMLATVSVRTFASFSDYQNIDKNIDVVVSYLQKARNQTINAQNDSQFGVQFASSSVALFQGTSYNSSAASNVVYNISEKVVLSSLSLTGGTTTVYFSQITGKPSATGTALFKLRSNASTTKTVIIYGSGLVEVQ